MAEPTAADPAPPSSQPQPVVIIQQMPMVRPVDIVMMGDCPYCHVGYAYYSFSILGIILAIVFFPIGLLCCFLLIERRCSYCGAYLSYPL